MKASDKLRIGEIGLPTRIQGEKILITLFQAFLDVTVFSKLRRWLRYTVIADTVIATIAS